VGEDEDVPFGEPAGPLQSSGDEFREIGAGLDLRQALERRDAKLSHRDR
jgi:hypothetical protein